MDVTEICKGCFSKKHGDEASACPYCEYEEGIVDVDGAGWKTGQLLSKRYLLGRLYMKNKITQCGGHMTAFWGLHA